MAVKEEWIAGDVSGTAIINAATLGSGSNLVSSEVDNAINKDRFADLELQIDFDTTAPTKNRVVEVYLLLARDGTNYEDGGVSVDPLKAPVGAFPVRDILTAQRLTLEEVRLPLSKIKVLLKSEVDQGSSTDSTTLRIWTYNKNYV